MADSTEVKRSSQMTYDPKTGTWSRSTVVSTALENKDTPTGNPDSGTPAPATSNNDNLISSDADKNTAAGVSEKNANRIEYNVLSGKCDFIATKKTIRLKAGETVDIQGLGSFLSGNYYVQDITRQVSSNGYSHSMTVIKTDFGESLKKKDTSAATADGAAKEEKAETKTETKTHTLKAGECLWTVAKKYYGNGADFEKIAKANGITPDQYTKLPNGLQLTIP